MSTGCEEGGKSTFWLSRNRLRMSRNAIETVSTIDMSMAGLSEIFVELQKHIHKHLQHSCNLQFGEQVIWNGCNGNKEQNNCC